MKPLPKTYIHNYLSYTAENTQEAYQFYLLISKCRASSMTVKANKNIYITCGYIDRYEGITLLDIPVFYNLH